MIIQAFKKNHDITACMINIYDPNDRDRRCFKTEENIFCGNIFAVLSKGWKL